MACVLVGVSSITLAKYFFFFFFYFKKISNFVWKWIFFLVSRTKIATHLITKERLKKVTSRIPLRVVPCWSYRYFEGFRVTGCRGDLTDSRKKIRREKNFHFALLVFTNSLCSWVSVIICPTSSRNWVWKATELGKLWFFLILIR